MSVFFTQISPIEKMSFGNEQISAPIANTVGTHVPFQSVLDDAISQVIEAEAVSAADNIRLATGNVDDLAQIQINSQKATALLQTTVQLTSRVISAYKEIIQMQV